MKSFRRYMSEGLDPVDKKALKGKHKDRKDGDIDNDGDVDSSDQYLHKRRKAIAKATTNEESEEIEDGAPTDQDFKDAAESVEEGTTTCPKCNGKGCEHCDGKGTHTDDQQIDEFVGKAIGGAVKMIAKGVRNTVTDKQGNVRGTKAARADSAEAKANKAEKKLKDAKRIKDAAARLADARKKAQENN